MQTVNPYDAWAELLQLWERFGDGRDIPFYVGLAREADRPIADLGIGWGRLAELIHPDVGVDYSPEMLVAARERIGEVRTELIEADLEDYQLAEPARFSYAGLKSFDHITSERSIVRIFENVRRNTVTGGRFAFDAEIYTRERLEATAYRVGLDGYDGEIAIQSSHRVVDADRLAYEVNAFVDWLDDDGTVTRRKYFRPLPGRSFPPTQYRAIFASTGWEVVDAWGGFQGEPLEDDGRHQVWLLEAA
jgi:SAM-dependent methyltransferase